MGVQPQQYSSRPGCTDNSAPICGSCCTVACHPTNTTSPKEHTTRVSKSSSGKDNASTYATDEEVKELLIIGAGPHGHAVMLRLLEPNPDFLTDKERHLRGEHTDRLRPINEVNKHIKNLSRGERATLRAKSRRSKKKDQLSHHPPHLQLKNVKTSTMVVDTHGGWMQVWKDNFESLQIKQLRSLMNAHTCPFDHRSLEYYAEAKGRGDELVTLKSLDQRDKHFKGPYQVPSTSIFNSFHDLLSKAYGVQDLVDTGTVLSINPRQVDGKSNEPIFEVEIAFGKETTPRVVKMIKTKRIVCSMGPIFRALEPPWLPDLPKEACERVLHAHQICPYLKRRSSEDNTDEVVRKILIVGGGITSAQLALLATEAKWCSENVTLIQRSKMTARHFDIENDWMGPQRGKLLDDFWCLDVNDRVKKLKETRGGGTIPPEIIRELVDQGRTSNKLQVKEEVEVSEVQWVDGRFQVTLDDDSEPTSYDMIWLATGAQNHIDHYSALSHLRQVLPVDVANGFPVLNTDLSWRLPTTSDEEKDEEPTWKKVARKRIWVTGALAAIELGPDALNLIGARHGSVRVARAIRQDFAQSKEAAAINSGIGEERDDCDCC